VVLVAGAIPGERVAVVLERESRQVAWGRVVEVLEPSPDRRPAACDPSCGGSFYTFVRYARQLQLKGEVIADAFRRIGKIALPEPPAVRPSPEHGYRLRARLHVRGGRAGFFREGTHELCDAAATGQIGPVALAAIDAALDAIGPRAADVAEIVVVENIVATERVLHLVARDGARLDDVAVLAGGVPGATGITTERKRHGIIVHGAATVTDRARDVFAAPLPIDASVAWSRHATSFFQANRFLLGALVARVLDLTPGERVADLYSGVGLFAVALAAAGRRVLAVEGDPASGLDLNANAAPFADRLEVAALDVEEALAHKPAVAPDAIVVDPPRAGLSPAALAGVLDWHVARLVYVSCDPPTLARDAAKLVAAGHVLRSIDAFDLFPNTPHVETVAVFDRA
jgi:23S rRNA (uracil1939-C5)-methyltransferase